MEEENQIIEAIIQRIKDEEKKHSKSIEDWYRIAANKIYATFDIKIKENMSNNKQSSIKWELFNFEGYSFKEGLSGTCNGTTICTSYTNYSILLLLAKFRIWLRFKIITFGGNNEQ